METLENIHVGVTVKEMHTVSRFESDRNLNMVKEILKKLAEQID
jgi:hypothetical protein